MAGHGIIYHRRYTPAFKKFFEFIPEAIHQQGILMKNMGAEG